MYISGRSTTKIDILVFLKYHLRLRLLSKFLCGLVDNRIPVYPHEWFMPIGAHLRLQHLYLILIIHLDDLFLIVIHPGGIRLIIVALSSRVA